jgi:phage baseplate assembly protein W
MRTQNPSDSSSPASIISSVVHSDLDLLFKPNPISGDINPLKDVEAIKNSVRNLMQTNFQERPFQPEIGSGIRGLLFELADPITMHDIEMAIQRTIDNFEPRVIVQNIDISDDIDNNAYNVSLTFQVIATEQVSTVTIILERLR